jgi:hypothetical protein
MPSAHKAPAPRRAAPWSLSRRVADRLGRPPVSGRHAGAEPRTFPALEAALVAGPVSARRHVSAGVLS